MPPGNAQEIEARRLLTLAIALLDETGHRQAAALVSGALDQLDADNGRHKEARNSSR
jgi:hypothetical protein